jgi:hypothetical protein
MSDNASSSSSSYSSEIVLAVDPRYKFGKIYKIFCDIEGEDDIYVGSTVRELEVRLDHHFIRARINTSTLHKFYNHMTRLGLEHFHIMLVEDYPCENDLVLRMREQHWMDELQPTLNTVKAFLSVDDYIANKKTLAKRYYTENITAIKAQHKIYYNKNKVDILTQHKVYRLENITAIKAQVKMRADIREKANRESGATYCPTCDDTFTTKSALKRHKKSGTHKAMELAQLLASSTTV